jgi:hypothetical protein
LEVISWSSLNNEYFPLDNLAAMATNNQSMFEATPGTDKQYHKHKVNVEYIVDEQ